MRSLRIPLVAAVVLFRVLPRRACSSLVAVAERARPGCRGGTARGASPPGSRRGGQERPGHPDRRSRDVLDEAAGAAADARRVRGRHGSERDRCCRHRRATSAWRRRVGRALRRYPDITVWDFVGAVVESRRRDAVRSGDAGAGQGRRDLRAHRQAAWRPGHTRRHRGRFRRVCRTTDSGAPSAAGSSGAYRSCGSPGCVLRPSGSWSATARSPWPATFRTTWSAGSWNRWWRTSRVCCAFRTSSGR